MSKALTYPLSVFAGIDATMLSRVLVSTGAIATIGNVTGISVLVQNSSGTTTYSGSVTVATAIVPLTVDARWTVDPIGYNFITVIPGSAWPTPDYYYVLYTFVDSAGNTFPLMWSGTAAGTA